MRYATDVPQVVTMSRRNKYGVVFFYQGTDHLLLLLKGPFQIFIFLFFH